MQEIIRELGKPMKQIDASSRTDLDQLEKVSHRISRGPMADTVPGSESGNEGAKLRKRQAASAPRLMGGVYVHTSCLRHRLKSVIDDRESGRQWSIHP